MGRHMIKAGAKLTSNGKSTKSKDVPKHSRDIIAKAKAKEGASAPPERAITGSMPAKKSAASSTPKDKNRSGTATHAPEKSKPLPPPVALPSESESDSDEEPSMPAEATSPSDDESDSDESSSAGVPQKHPAKMVKSESSSSEESSSESDEEAPPTTPIAKNTVPAKESSESENASDSDEDSDEDSDDNSKDDESSGADGDSPSTSPKTPSTKAAKSAAPPVRKVEVKRKGDEPFAQPAKKAKLANGAAAPAVTDQETKNVFVGKLSWNVDDDWLSTEFAECGEIMSARVQMDRNTGKSRGFGYVHFTTAEAAQKALTLDGKEIDGRPIRVDLSTPFDKNKAQENRAKAFGDKISEPSATLYVGNLSYRTVEDTLYEVFGDYGDVKAVRLPTDRETGEAKGFGYVEFNDVKSAKQAFEAMNGKDIDGRPVRLDYNKPKQGANAGFSAGGRGRDASGGRGRGFGGRGRGGYGSHAPRGQGRGRGGRGGGARTGGITDFQGKKTTF